MAYIDIAQLAQRLGPPAYARLTDRDSGHSADDGIAQQIVDEAQAEADAYLARRFATPLDLSLHPELAPLLAARVLDLAEHAAWRSSPFVANVPPRVAAARSQALAWLERLAAGALELPAAATPPSRTGADDSPRASGAPRTLTADELAGW